LAVPAMRNRRFGNVGPGSEQNQRSDRANVRARAE
jgi:hypothetical protein